MSEKPTHEEFAQTIRELEQPEIERNRLLARLRTTLEATADGILVVDRSGKIVLYSKRFAKMWNLPESVLDSKDDNQALAFVLDQLKDPEGFLTKVRELYADPDAKSFDTLQFKDGRFFERYSRPHILNDEVIGRVWSFRDVTESKRLENALRESEEKYRNLVENINDVIFSTDENGNITYVSPAIKTSIGYDPSEVIGRNFSEFIHKDDLPYVLNRFQGILYGELEPAEYRILAKTGAYRWVRSSSSPVYKGDNIVGLRGIFADITEQKHLEDQLRQAHKMEAIGTLASGIAHEFNNILGIIIGNTELAINDVSEWNPAQDCLEEIRAASLRAKDVVRQILNFARKSHIKRKPVPLSPIIRHTFKLIRASLPSSIDIRQNISCEHDTVLADPTQISQVLVNICTNSAHAMRKEGGLLDVRLENIFLDDETAAPYEDLFPGNHVKLTVEDTGLGIKPEIMNRIFDPYFSTKGEGTGMGLSVAHGIVKSHNGAITVYSELGKGSVVEVLFPIIGAEIELEVVESEDLPTGDEKILFVDDEESLVKITKQRLERLGLSG